MSDLKFLIPRYNDEENFRTIVEPSIKRLGVNCPIVNIADEPGQHLNIFQKYNNGISLLLTHPQMLLKDEDIVIFQHSDLGIVDPFFIQKIEMVFNERKDIGLLGVIGTSELLEEGGWWNPINYQRQRGHIIQGKDDGAPGEGEHLIKGNQGFFDDIVMLDGVFLAFSGRIIKEGFKWDTTVFPDGHDFYDADACLTVLEMGYSIAISDILLFHKSRGYGALKDEWKINHDRFVNKWKSKGYKFPVISTDFKKKENKIIEVEI